MVCARARASALAAADVLLRHGLLPAPTGAAPSGVLF
jgi:hypothetical protein